MAESEGFEPSMRLPPYTLSRGAPSATRPALQNSNFSGNKHCARLCMAHVRVTPGSGPSPFGPSAKIADVLNRSRRFSQPLGQLSEFNCLPVQPSTACLNMAHVRVTADSRPSPFGPHFVRSKPDFSGPEKTKKQPSHTRCEAYLC